MSDRARGDRPLRVVIGVPFGERTGGSEAVLLGLLRHRERARLQPRIWFGEEGGFRAEVDALGVRTDVAGQGRSGAAGVASAARWLVRHVRSQPTDALVSWLPRAHLVTGPAAIATGMTRRTVCWQHIVPTGNWRHWLAFALPAAGVITNSSSSEAGQLRLRPRRPVRVVWPGVDEPARASPDELAGLARRLGIDDGRPVVGIVGRLVGWKGQERLLEAVGRLRSEGLSCRVLVVGGEDPHERDGTEARLRRQTADLGLGADVVLTGQVDDAIPYIQLMDVLVNASDEEPFGIVLIEAMALGVPVVAVARGGPVEILEGGDSGLLVPTGSPADLAGGIAAVLRDRALRERLVAGGRARFEERFSAARMAEEVGDALRELIRTG